ncbi:MAG: FtsX-like permease family protein [Candidatus Glassbacteria bacterium]|nr:FtsX-like permease family protein [Candidatus Glassbacteria bacterium]
MNLWRLVSREISYQKLGFLLGLLSVAAATSVLVAALTMLRSHDLRTGQILAGKQAETEKEMARMEDDYRVIMKKLGFNLLILPASQSMQDYYATGYVTEYMPEEYVARLAGAGLMTIRHLLPSVERQISWSEQGGRRVILAGTRGEVPLAHLAPKEPIRVAVARGKVVVGYELARSLKLRENDEVLLLGERFTVGAIHAERGTRDDITLWIDLETAQRMLGLQGRINAILALKCLCAGNELAQIRSDVAAVLPGTRVIEVDSRVVTRAEARRRAGLAAKTALASERENRAVMRAELEKFAAWLSPVVILGATLWIGLLSYGNVRQRRREIAVLRAIGVSSSQVMKIFLSKALILGLAGAMIGYFAGLAAGTLSGELAAGLEGVRMLFDFIMLLGVLFIAPLLCVLASWIPALAASGQDPAEVLREE